jgi:hypothetical protein
MINPPWLELHPSHLGRRRQTTLAKFFWFMRCGQAVSALSLIRHAII